MGDYMKFMQFIVSGLILFGAYAAKAQTSSADQSKPSSPSKTEAPVKKKQSRADFYDGVFKMFKTHKQEQKDLQIQFINKQFNQELKNQKDIIEIQKKMNPTNSPDANKKLIDQINLTNKTFQENSQKEGDQFFKKVLTEKSKEFFEKMNKITKEYDSTN